MRHLLLALTAFFTVLSSPSLAQDVVVPYENMVSVLSGFHGMPGKDYFDRLKPDAARETLMKIVGDEQVFPVARGRAMLALAYFKNDDALNLVTGKVMGDKNPYLRSSALEALTNMEGAKAVKTIGAGLKDSDVMVRLSAIRSLKKIGGDEARKLIEESLAEEKNPTAAVVMKNSLEQMR
jgi:hypothetical protein